MKISYRWLQEFVACGHVPVERIADVLTMAGLELEGIETSRFQVPETVVVGKVVQVEPHPDASSLVICQVDVGQTAPLTIVCGAPNARVGIKSPVALPETTLPNGMTIKISPVRGVVSHGMLCAEDELGLSADHRVIIELPDDAPVGKPVTHEMLAFEDDTVLEIGLTPNRGDCLSHVGVAREVSTLLGLPLRTPPVDYAEQGEAISALASVTIHDPDLCYRYTASVIRGVTIGPSPLWLRRRLENLGIRAINNVVDVTNYVMMELGQPLHAFDYDLLADRKIIVRRAQAGEVFTTLDGTARRLDEQVLMIADGHRSIGIAGVMGGQNSEVSDATTTVLLESAYFSPSSIRSTSKKLGLSTEASYRFERAIDLLNVDVALRRATKLIADLAHGTVTQGILDVFPHPLPPTQITLRPQRVHAILGVEVPGEKISSILAGLGFAVEPIQSADVPESSSSLMVRVPSYRPDVEREIDLIEEIGRIYGFEKIPTTLPSGEIPPRIENPARDIEQQLKNLLISQGLYEVINYSFFDSKHLEALLVADIPPYHQVVRLKNPLNAEQNVLRTTLLPGLLGNVALNRKKTELIRFFETGRVFIQSDPAAPLPNEYVRISGVLGGGRTTSGWDTKRADVDFYDLKGLLENIFQTIGLAATFTATDTIPFLHPGEAALICAGDSIIGMAGKVHPDVLENFQLDQERLYLFELSLEQIAAQRSTTKVFQQLPKFPAGYRDLALVVPRAVQAAAVEKVIREAGCPLLEQFALFDRYVGTQITAGSVGLTYALTYRSDEKTLTDDEVAACHQRIIQQLQTQLGVGLR